MRVVLSGRAERIDISNNFLSGLRNPGGIQFAGQPVGMQRPINYFVHEKNSELMHCDSCSATSPFDMVKPNFWQDLPMTSASGRKRRNRRGSRRDHRMSCRPVRAWGFNSRHAPPSPAISRVTPSRDQTICADNSQRLARNQAWLTRWLRSLSVVPELTRGIDIKLNARLSLHGH
jgi:hypothetical protein